MNISLECAISLSKKLRAILGDKGGTVTLSTSDLVNGKGVCILSMSSEDKVQYNELPESLSGETSIMITPMALREQVPANSEVSNIFSSVPSGERKSPVVDKLAVTEPPEKGKESVAVVAQVETPEEFSQIEEPECRDYIMGLSDLVEATRTASKKSRQEGYDDDDIEGIVNVREKAVALEERDKAESMDRDAYIVNEEYGLLSINDLDVDLKQNVPFNLGNISARRIVRSGDLKSLLKSGMVRFVTPEEAAVCAERAVSRAGESEDMLSLDVYSSPEEAERALEKKIPPVDAVEMTNDNLDNPTEEEELINLTNIQVTKKDSIDGARTSHHGASAEVKAERPKVAVNPDKPKPKTIKSRPKFD